MEDPLLFASAVATLLATPGPTNALLAAAGASAGFRRSLNLLVAALTGYLVTILLLGAALGSFLPNGARTVLSFLAAAYLAVLAVRLWRVAPDGAAANIGWRHVFVTTMLNPKGLIFAFVIVPLQSGHAWLYVAGFTLICVVAGGCWAGAGALVGRAGGDKVRALVPKATSAALGVLAVVLIVRSLVA
jgi:threonine/homoserine/homoserine lactone efflux protein